MQQFGATIRAPKSGTARPTDPAQQALMDAMQQNGAPDPQQSIDKLPAFQTAMGAGGGASRTTQPVPITNQSVPGSGIGMTGGIAQGTSPMQTNSPGPKQVSGQDALNSLAPPQTGGISSQFPSVSPFQLSQGVNAAMMQNAPPAQQAAAGMGSAAGAAAGAQGAPQGLGQYTSSLEGFDSGKLNDPNKHDAKYDFARIASNYPPTPAGLQQAMAQIKQAYPNAQLIGDDKVDFGDGYGPVDVIRAAGDGGKAWHFEGQDNGAAQGASGAAPGGQGGDPMTQLTQLQAGAQQGDTYSKMVLQYLMQQLGLDGAMMQNSR